MSKGLTWPPKKEDLERLYVERRLSAMKVAEAYGLKHASPKTSESTVLYHLKRNGIPRRDPAARLRRVSEGLADEWVRRYEAGESLSKIAGGEFSGVTVWNHLRKRGVKLRDKVEAQIATVTKHVRMPFDGTAADRAYMMGLRYGDLDVVSHGRAVRVRVSTTHPAMAELFQSLFTKYGFVRRTPRLAKLTGYEWTLECDLHGTFEFLLIKPDKKGLESIGDDVFLPFLAGLFDAEGTIHLHRKRMWYNPEAIVSNSEPAILEFVESRLRRLGYHPAIRWLNQRADRKGVKGGGKMGRVEIARVPETLSLLQKLPIVHGERLARRKIVVKMRYPASFAAESEAAGEWRELSSDIKRRTKEFIAEAKQSLVLKINPYPSCPESIRESE